MSFVQYFVLIETYWNVNSSTDSSHSTAVTGLNRNILECKLIRWRVNGVLHVVLIETYWNVNS